MPPKKRNRVSKRRTRELQQAFRNVRGRWMRSSAQAPINVDWLNSDLLRAVLTNVDTRWVDRESEPSVEVVQRRNAPIEIIDDDDDDSDDNPPAPGSNGNDDVEDISDEDTVDLPPAPIKSMKEFLEAMDKTKILVFHNFWEVNLKLFKEVWDNTDVNDTYTAAEGGFQYLWQSIKLLMLRDTSSLNVHFEDGKLELNMGYVVNLRKALFLYLLYYLSNLRPGNYHLFATTEGASNKADINIGNVVIPPSFYISYNDVIRVFDNITQVFRYFFEEEKSDNDYWKDENDSGEVIWMEGDKVITFKLMNIPGMMMSMGSCWNEALATVLDQVFPDGGLITVKNPTDNLCLLYSIAMGYCRLANPTFFPWPERYIDLNLVAKRIDESKIDHWAMKCAKDLMIKIRSRKPGDEISGLLDEDTSLYSTKEMCEKLKKIEKDFVDEKTALDVYMLRISLTNILRVFPCYMSNRKISEDKDRIKIVNIEVKGLKHFCVITSLRKLFKNTGGKIFEVCPNCHKAFFSRAARMSKHKCGEDPDTCSWNNIYTPPDQVAMAGICMKCHLKFVDVWEYEYHKKHCFMKNRTGSRHVVLADKDYLVGGSNEQDDDSEKMGRRKLYFADFESSIDSEGKHTVMSYGIYDCEGHHYYRGRSLEAFMTCIISFSKEHKEIHVYFHNAMNYDANFILRYVLQYLPDWSINVIMKSSNRLQTINFIWVDGKTQRRIRIGDTYHFMTMSLDRIVSSIRKDDLATNIENFPRFFEQFRKWYPGIQDLQIDKVLHKNLFPYRFFDKPEKLDASFEVFEYIFRPLPENLQYFSENVTEEELRENYPKFREICEIFNVKTAWDYHNIYLLCDVMEITDVFLKARESLHNTHKIDVCKYIGMPGASWAAFMKMSSQLMLPMYRNTLYAEFFQSMTRGGVTSAPLRYAKSDATHSIIYLDVNGLYPFVMQKYLYPMGEMVWKVFGPEENEDPMNYFKRILCPRLKKHKRGCCIAVDMYFPPNVKRKTDQFPFAPEHRVLKDCYFDENGQMYPFLQRWSDANNGEKMKTFTGLVGTLYPKTEYGVHWKLLKWYVKHGVIITRLHYGVFFDEGDYLKEYVSLNISIRNTRKDELGKMVYKLLGNSIYGKTFESPFNRGTYYIVRNKEKLTGMLEDGNVASITPIDENNCIVKIDDEEVVLDKPTYIGACVTEYAKLHMYKLFYDKLMGVFPNIELIYTDTDSFIVRVEHEAGISPEELFDYIELRCPGLFGSIGGQIKSETGTDDLIEEVIAIRSKLYAYKTLKGKIGKRAKGTTAAAQEKELNWETYKNALFGLKAVPTHNMQFKRDAFEIRTVDMVKQSISVNDGKRFICEDGIHTHAWGWDEFNPNDGVIACGLPSPTLPVITTTTTTTIHKQDDDDDDDDTESKMFDVEKLLPSCLIF